MNSERPHSLPRFLARATSLLTLGILLTYGFGALGEVADYAVSRPVLFALFPIGVGLGLVLGWRNELAGGALTLLSTATLLLLLVRIDNGLPSGLSLTLMGLPGVLFLWAGWSERGQRGDPRL